MGFIFNIKNIVNDYEKAKKIKESPKLIPKVIIKNNSIDNFMKLQWSWTL